MSQKNNTGRKPFVYTEGERKLLRKINIISVPFLFAAVFLLHMNRSVLNISSTLGLFEDTGISGSQYRWLGSLYYIGNVAFLLPNQYLLQRLPLSKYLGTTLIISGIIVSCNALASNFTQLAALRLLLGGFEEPAYPCTYLLIGTIYRRSEQIIWFRLVAMGPAISHFFIALLGYGSLSLDGAYGLRAWRWCMITLGCTTICVGLLYFFFLPDKPKSRWYRLSEEEKKIVDERIRDSGLIQNRVIKYNHIKEAIREPQLYTLAILSSFLLNLQNGCIANFSALIIKGMGFSNIETILFGIPSGLASMVVICIAMYLSYRLRELGYFGALFTSVSLLGALLLTALPAGKTMLSGLFLASVGPSDVLCQTMFSINVTGYTKRIFYIGASAASLCLGSFVGPLLMFENQAPRYLNGMLVYMVADSIAVILFLYTRQIFVKENLRRQTLKDQGKIPDPPSNREEIDWTDVEDLNFVYKP
ncbi:major facilitator superfamily domain-containing protein [Fennellomyces sp. T-0311]|nr:major facilitator superfamily domain-containing protein [Fennellomyces sp. T-0311]